MIYISEEEDICIDVQGCNYVLRRGAVRRCVRRRCFLGRYDGCRAVSESRKCFFADLIRRSAITSGIFSADACIIHGITSLALSVSIPS